MRQIRLRKMLNRLILRKTDRINNISKHFFVISIFYIDIIGATGRIMHMVHIFSHKKNKKNIIISNILTIKSAEKWWEHEASDEKTFNICGLRRWNEARGQSRSSRRGKNAWGRIKKPQPGLGHVERTLIHMTHIYNFSWTMPIHPSIHPSCLRFHRLYFIKQPKLQCNCASGDSLFFHWEAVKLHSGRQLPLLQSSTYCVGRENWDSAECVCCTH